MSVTRSYETNGAHVGFKCQILAKDQDESEMNKIGFLHTEAVNSVRKF